MKMKKQNLRIICAMQEPTIQSLTVDPFKARVTLATLKCQQDITVS